MAEGNGTSTVDFYWKCDPSNIRETIQYNTLITQFESGKEQRRSKAEPRRIWSLKFRKSPSTASSMWTFYQNKKGSFESFTWINPLDNQEYTVRFMDDNLSRNVFWKMVYDFGIDLIEVI